MRSTDTPARRLPLAGPLTSSDAARIRQQLRSGCRVFPKQIAAQWGIDIERAEQFFNEAERSKRPSNSSSNTTIN